MSFRLFHRLLHPRTWFLRERVRVKIVAKYKITISRKKKFQKIQRLSNFSVVRFPCVEFSSWRSLDSSESEKGTNLKGKLDCKFPGSSINCTILPIDSSYMRGEKLSHAGEDHLEFPANLLVCSCIRWTQWKNTRKIFWSRMCASVQC